GACHRGAGAWLALRHVVSPAVGLGGLSFRSPTPPAVINAPFSPAPSSWPPAEVVMRVPLTSTVLNCPDGWKPYEMPRLRFIPKLGSPRLTGSARATLNVSPVVCCAPYISVTLPDVVTVGSSRITARISPSRL